MATRSRIFIQVRPETKGQTITPEIGKLPEPFNPLKGVKIEPTTIEKEYIGIYHHWDGYPAGVGETLLNKYNDYDKALNLILFGDESTINGNEIVPYHYWRENEPWKDTKPRQVDTIDQIPDEEYQYLLTPEGWLCNDGGYEWDGWKPLQEILAAENEK